MFEPAEGNNTKHHSSDAQMDDSWGGGPLPLMMSGNPFNQHLYYQGRIKVGTTHMYGLSPSQTSSNIRTMHGHRMVNNTHFRVVIQAITMTHGAWCNMTVLKEKRKQNYCTTIVHSPVVGLGDVCTVSIISSVLVRARVSYERWATLGLNLARPLAFHP